ncbi:MAG: 2OG-Fe(II) oxygenase [Pseudomonadota bacterium]
MGFLRRATATAASMLDLERVRATPLETSPYEYLVVRDFIRPEARQMLIDAYPVIGQAGSFPLTTVQCSDDFLRLIDEMDGPGFRAVIEEKFGIDLKGKPTMYTVRGKCRLKDGQVHTDSESKIITVLLYMNPGNWPNDGGRLRVLRSNDVNDVAAEVPPDIGTLLVFRRSDTSWHGHLPFEGDRRVIQMNWVTHSKYVDREHKRHRWSAAFKKLIGRRDGRNDIGNDY